MTEWHKVEDMGEGQSCRSILDIPDSEDVVAIEWATLVRLLQAAGYEEVRDGGIDGQSADG